MELVVLVVVVVVVVIEVVELDDALIDEVVVICVLVLVLVETLVWEKIRLLVFIGWRVISVFF